MLPTSGHLPSAIVPLACSSLSSSCLHRASRLGTEPRRPLALPQRTPPAKVLTGFKPLQPSCTSGCSQPCREAQGTQLTPPDPTLRDTVRPGDLFRLADTAYCLPSSPATSPRSTGNQTSPLAQRRPNARLLSHSQSGAHPVLPRARATVNPWPAPFSSATPCLAAAAAAHPGCRHSYAPCVSSRHPDLSPAPPAISSETTAPDLFLLVFNFTTLASCCQWTLLLGDESFFLWPRPAHTPPRTLLDDPSYCHEELSLTLLNLASLALPETLNSPLVANAHHFHLPSDPSATARGTDKPLSARKSISS